jgi:hypothetical protein
MTDNTQLTQDVDPTEDKVNEADLDEVEELLLGLVDSVIARLQSTPTKEKTK